MNRRKSEQAPIEQHPGGVNRLCGSFVFPRTLGTRGGDANPPPLSGRQGRHPCPPGSCSAQGPWTRPQCRPAQVISHAPPLRMRAEPPRSGHASRTNTVHSRTPLCAPGVHLQPALETLAPRRTSSTRMCETSLPSSCRRATTAAAAEGPRRCDWKHVKVTVGVSSLEMVLCTHTQLPRDWGERTRATTGSTGGAVRPRCGWHVPPSQLCDACEQRHRSCPPWALAVGQAQPLGAGQASPHAKPVRAAGPYLDDGVEGGRVLELVQHDVRGVLEVRALPLLRAADAHTVAAAAAAMHHPFAKW